MTRAWAWLLSKLQERCRHDAKEGVSADVLEGDAVKSNLMVQWCRVCGAYRRASLEGAFARVGEWQRPRPLWWVGR